MTDIANGAVRMLNPQELRIGQGVALVNAVLTTLNGQTVDEPLKVLAVVLAQYLVNHNGDRQVLNEFRSNTAEVMQELRSMAAAEAAARGQNGN